MKKLYPYVILLLVFISCKNRILNQWKWYALNTGAKIYAARRMPKKAGGDTVLMHRHIIGVKDGLYIDHFDGDTLNNQKSNLRICSMSQNIAASFPQKRNKSSAYKGVFFDKDRRGTKKWRAYIRADYKKIELGRFYSENEAALAYNRKASELFGEFARLNEISA